MLDPAQLLAPCCSFRGEDTDLCRGARSGAWAPLSSVPCPAPALPPAWGRGKLREEASLVLPIVPSLAEQALVNVCRVNA